MKRAQIKRAMTGKRAKLTALATGAIMATTAALAWALPQPIVGKADNTFAAPVYELTGGQVATLQIEGGTHNATAVATQNGLPIFASATISSGSTPVNGTQFLPAGSYSFVCTIHPGMASNLLVSGTPQKPTLNVSILSKRLKQVAKSGNLMVSATSTAPSVKVVAKQGAKTLGTTTGAPGNLTVKLSGGAKRSLAKKTSARISVTAEVEFGDPVTASKKLK